MDHCQPVFSFPAAIHRVVSTTGQETQVREAQSMGQGGSTFFVFAVYALVGLVLAIAAVMWFVTQKHKRRQRRRLTAKEDREGKDNQSFQADINPLWVSHVVLCCTYPRIQWVVVA